MSDTKGDTIKAAIKAEMEKGTDMSNPQTYMPILKQLAQDNGVSYSYVRKLLDQVRHPVNDDTELIPPPEKTSAPGQPKVEIVRKETPADQVQAAQQQPQQPGVQVQYPREKIAAVLKTMLKRPISLLDTVIEHQWGVEVDAPEDAEMDDLAETWADVLQAYDVKFDKVMLLVLAAGQTASTVGMPIIAAKMKKDALDKQKEEEAKKAKAVKGGVSNPPPEVKEQ